VFNVVGTDFGTRSKVFKAKNPLLNYQSSAKKYKN